MDTVKVLWAAVLLGLGTYLFRLLPFLWSRSAGQGNSPVVRRTLAAIGPAAIIALIVVSLWPNTAHMPTLLATLAGVAAVAAAKRWGGGIAWPTLAGAVAYGLCLRLL